MDPSGLCAGDPCNTNSPNRDTQCWWEAIALYQAYGVVTAGTWTYDQVKLLYDAMDIIARKMGNGDLSAGQGRFRGSLGQIHPTYDIRDAILVNPFPGNASNGTPAFTDPWFDHRILIARGVLFGSGTSYAIDTLIHELGHVIHFNSARGFATNEGLLGNYKDWIKASCKNTALGADCTSAGNMYDPGSEPPAGDYGASALWEDFATAWGAFFRSSSVYGSLYPNTQPLRYSYMSGLVAKLSARSAKEFSKSEGWTKFYGCKSPLPDEVADLCLSGFNI